MVLGRDYEGVHSVNMDKVWTYARWMLMSAAVCAGTMVAQTSSPANGNASVTASQPNAPKDYYTLHPGDTVTVTFRFTPEFNDEVVIGPDGRAVLKATGDIQMAGMTLPELEREIVVDSAAKLVDPDVTVTLKEFERPVVVVAGEVQTPSKIELRKPTTALQAILIAGGPKEDSAMNHVYLFRKINSDTMEVHVLQLGRYEARDRAKNDLLLQPGDMILIKRDGLEKIGRFIKTFNIGTYFNPIGNNGIF